MHTLHPARSARGSTAGTGIAADPADRRARRPASRSACRARRRCPWAGALSCRGTRWPSPWARAWRGPHLAWLPVLCSRTSLIRRGLAQVLWVGSNLVHQSWTSPSMVIWAAAQGRLASWAWRRMNLRGQWRRAALAGALWGVLRDRVGADREHRRDHACPHNEIACHRSILFTSLSPSSRIDRLRKIATLADSPNRTGHPRSVRLVPRLQEDDERT